MSYLFKYIEKYPVTIYLKLIWCIAVAVGLAAAAEFSTLTNSRYIASLTFGYVNYRIWGETGRPSQQIAWFWWGFQTIFFGCTGASLLVSEIKKGDLGYGALAILIGLCVRMLTVTVGIYFPVGKYNLKERVFMAMAWFPKATV